MVDELTERALNDFRGEGLPTTDVKWQLELDLKFGGQLNTKRTMMPILRLHNADDVQTVYKAFEKEYSEAYSAMGLTPEAGVEVENFVLRATIAARRSPRYRATSLATAIRNRHRPGPGGRIGATLAGMKPQSMTAICSNLATHSTVPV